MGWIDSLYRLYFDDHFVFDNQIGAKSSTLSPSYSIATATCRSTPTLPSLAPASK
jgi:hypothetical protein